MPQIREQIAMVHLPPSKTLKYLFHVRKTMKRHVQTHRFVRAFSSDKPKVSTPVVLNPSGRANIRNRVTLCSYNLFLFTHE